ncbi:MAG: hypothetical protein PVF73_03445 [Bacteroidales bacterium]|jgi:hypothetical protein
MGYTTKVSETGDYILITVHGKVNSEIAMQYTVESHKLGKEKGILKFLVDLRNARNTETIVDNYNFVIKDLPENQTIDRKAKVVLLVSKEDHSHDFVETVSRNRGFNVTLFRDKDEAISYLMA